MTERKKAYPWQKHYPEGIRWDEQIPIAPLYSILDKTAAAHPEQTCLDYQGMRYSYAEIQQLANKMAKGLQHMGVQKGVKVGLLLPNCPLYIISYFAILKAGGTVVNYNPLYTINELTHQVQDSETVMMVTLDLKILCEKTSTLLRTTPLQKVIIGNLKSFLPFPKNYLFEWVSDIELANILYGHVNVPYNEVINNDGKYEKQDINPLEDVAVLQYTGGTTGIPKGAMLTHANAYVNCHQAGLWFHGLEEGRERMMAVLPFFHVFAMTVVMNLSILKGCEIVVHCAPRLDVGKLLKEIENKHITLLPGVPTLFNALTTHKKTTASNLRSLKFCISGGAPLPEDVKTNFEALSGCTLVEGYGLSEASPIVSANPLFGKNKPGSIGMPLPGTVIEIRSMDGRRTLVAKGKLGEICVRGPQVMKGYYNREDETEAVLQHGRLHTGDLGYMDSEGYVFVADRMKDMIIVSGFNVYPREVEEEIYRHPLVNEVCVLGVEDNYHGQAVHAYVVVKSGKKLTEAELKESLKNKLVKYKIPSKIEFVQELPKTMIGKISKREVLAQLKK